MGKNINHIQHKKSSVVENGLPKLPNSDALVEGEIAINYSSGVETISLKNSSGDIVTFSSDNYYSEKKLGSLFTGENSGLTVTDVIADNELIIASSLNDLNVRKLDASAYTETDLTDVYNKINTVSGTVNTHTADTTVHITAAERTSWNAKLDASDIENFFGAVNYDSDTKRINFYNETTGGTVLAYVDATDFIKDGMVDSVTIDEPTSGENSGSTCLIITFNTDAGKENIEIPLTEIFDADEYYTKTEIDDKLGSGFTGANSAKTITEVIEEDELAISSALNDLNTRKLDASAYTEPDLSGYLTIENFEDKIGSGFTGENSGLTITKVIEDTEKVIANSLNDLNSRKLDASAYTEPDLSGYLTIENFEDKIGSGFTGENSGRTITEVIEDNEEIVAASLNDLNERKLDASAYTETDLTDVYNKINTVSGNVNTHTADTIAHITSEERLKWNNAISGVSFNNSAATVVNGVASINVVDYANSAEYDSNAKKIYFKHDGTTLSSMTIDADDFIKDGMVESAWTIDSGGTTYLRIKWNNDAGDATTDIDIGDLFEADNYYNKTAIDNKLGSGFTGNNSGRTVTEVFEDFEFVTATALNDLNAKKLDASAYTETDLSGYYTIQEIDNKLGSGFTGENSGRTITEVIEDDEEAIAASIADLDDKISGNTTFITQVNAKADTIASALTRYTPSGYSYSKAETDLKITSISGDVATLSGNVITKDGTASQFVKGDGTLDSTPYALGETAGGPAAKAVSIPFGQLDSTSTAALMTATVPGITELRSGVCMYLKNGVIASTSASTLDINGLGAKPLYRSNAAATKITTTFGTGYTYFFVYNETRVDGGCWDIYYGYDANDYSWAKNIFANDSRPTTSQYGRYRLLFTSADGNKWVPANSATTSASTGTKAVTQTKINPFGEIAYYTSTATGASNSSIAAASACTQYSAVTLGYSFTNKTLTNRSAVYIKCAPQSDGSAIIDSTNPWVQALPSTDDGKIYIYLGQAVSTTAAELSIYHPVYYYKDGAVRIWTNASDPDVTAQIEEKLGSGFTGENSGVTVTDAINETERVAAAALNYLYENKLDISAYTEVDVNAKEDKIGVVSVIKNADFTAEANKYYTVTVPNNTTLTVTLPSGLDSSSVKKIMFYVTLGTGTSNIAFSPIIAKDEGFANLQASSTYQMEATWNGIGWIVTQTKLTQVS